MATRSPDDDEHKIVETFVKNGNPIMALFAMMIRRPRLIILLLTLMISTGLYLAGYPLPDIGRIVGSLPLHLPNLTL